MISITGELDDFTQFVTEHLTDTDSLTLEQGLQRFRQYQRELASAREKLRVAEEQSSRGESRPLDTDALKTEVRKRLAADGVAE